MAGRFGLRFSLWRFCLDVGGGLHVLFLRCNAFGGYTFGVWKAGLGSPPGSGRGIQIVELGWLDWDGWAVVLWIEGRNTAVS